MTPGCLGMGGIKEIILFDFDSITDVEITANTYGDIQISDITLDEGKKGYLYKLAMETGGLTTTYNKNIQSGTLFAQSELTVVFNKMTTKQRTEVENIVRGELRVIVLDQNGSYWLLGFDNPVQATAGTGSTGTASGDANQYSLTLTDWSKQAPYEIDTTAIPITDLL